MIPRNISGALITCLIIPTLWPATASALPQQARVRVSPAVVRMGAFYGGATVRVEGSTGSDEKIVVIVRGPKVTEVFNQARRLGPIWVNTGKVSVAEVPSLLLIFSSEPLNACLRRAAIDTYGLDLPGLKRLMRIECGTRDHARAAEDYLLYKGRQGSYRLVDGGFRVSQQDPGGLSYTAYSLEFALPRCAGPGEYQISVLECRGGDVVERSNVPLKVVEVGLPALVALLAARHPSFYGILSVVAALLAGFGIDFIAARWFRRKAERDSSA